MTYTDVEKDIMKVLDRTDFRNLAKSEFVTYASYLKDCNTEVALEILQKYPDFLEFLKEGIKEYGEYIKKIIESDDESLKLAFGVIDMGIDTI